MPMWSIVFPAASSASSNARSEDGSASQSFRNASGMVMVVSQRILRPRRRILALPDALE
jgi:hypothetical protein